MNLRVLGVSAFVLGGIVVAARCFVAGTRRSIQCPGPMLERSAIRVLRRADQIAASLNERSARGFSSEIPMHLFGSCEFGSAAAGNGIDYFLLP